MVRYQFEGHWMLSKPQFTRCIKIHLNNIVYFRKFEIQALARFIKSQTQKKLKWPIIR